MQEQSQCGKLSVHGSDITCLIANERDYLKYNDNARSSKSVLLCAYGLLLLFQMDELNSVK